MADRATAAARLEEALQVGHARCFSGLGWPRRAKVVDAVSCATVIEGVGDRAIAATKVRVPALVVPLVGGQVGRDVARAASPEPEQRCADDARDGHAERNAGGGRAAAPRLGGCPAAAPA